MKQRNILCVVGAALVMVAFPCISAHAQESYSAAVKAGLHRDVTLHMGRTTIDAVVIALEKKTGLTIQMAKYLRGHKVQCDVEGVSARSVLDAFVQMNHWRWYETTHPGTIALVGKAAGVARTLTQLPQALRQCMDQDFIRMLMAEQPHFAHQSMLLKKAIADALKAGDRESAFVYQNSIDSTTASAISQLSDISDALLVRYAKELKPPAPSQETGGKLPLQLMRSGFLGICGRLFSVTTGDASNPIYASLPPDLVWVHRTHICRFGTAVSVKLAVGHPHGNQFTMFGPLIDLNPNLAGYIP